MYIQLVSLGTAHSDTKTEAYVLNYYYYDASYNND